MDRYQILVFLRGSYQQWGTPRHGCATLVFKWTAPQYTHAVARWSPLSARDTDRFEESLGCQSFRMRSCLDLRPKCQCDGDNGCILVCMLEPARYWNAIQFLPRRQFSRFWVQDAFTFGVDNWALFGCWIHQWCYLRQYSANSNRG